MLIDVAARRVFRLASAMALSVVVGYGFNLPLPFLCPLMTLILLFTPSSAIGLKAGLGLILVVFLALGTGLLLAPVMLNYAFAGVMIVALSLYHCFYHALKGGSALVRTFVTMGLVHVTAAGTVNFAYALIAVEAIAKAILVAVVISWVVYPLFPEDKTQDIGSSALPTEQAQWIALRSLLVVMPVFLLVLYDPSKYMPMVLKSVTLSQEIGASDAHSAGYELIVATFVGGVLAVMFCCLLQILPILWMFFLWMLLFFIYIASKLYGVLPTRHPSSFWRNAAITMILLLGSALMDSSNGNNVMRAFAVRFGLFLLVALYAWGAVYFINRWYGHNKIGKEVVGT